MNVIVIMLLEIFSTGSLSICFPLIDLDTFTEIFSIGAAISVSGSLGMTLTKLGTISIGSLLFDLIAFFSPFFSVLNIFP